MKDIQQKIQDWEQIKALSNKVRVSLPKDRKSAAQQLYGAIRTYYGKYHTKFDYHNPPKEE